MTQIIKDKYKDARFRKGHVVTEEDIPLLLSMGKEHLYVWEMMPGMVHENDAAERLLALCGQENMTRTEVKEGKIELRAACSGVFLVDSARLIAVNSQDEVMIATRKGGTAVHKGDKLAGMRVIPLMIEEEKLRRAEQAAGSAPLLALRPFVRRTACIVATGGEVRSGLIRDTFTPVVIGKLKTCGIETLEVIYSGDGVENVRNAVLDMRAKKPDMILCTGGMSVDPDDNTPGGIKAAGADIVAYGIDETAIAGNLTYGSNVKEVTTAVSEGTVDCGIIYASDAYSANLTVAAEATADMCGQVIYPAAVLNTSAYQEAAAAFLAYLQTAEASAEFEKVLFTPLNK